MSSHHPARGLAACMLLSALCVACTANDASTTAPLTGSTAARAPESTATAPAVRLSPSNARFAVDIRQIGGGIPRPQRGRLRDAIGAPVSAWIDHAFLDVDYPADDFPAAFASWTPGAAQLATRDRDLTTNAALGPDLVAVVANEQRARLYVFATNSVTGGATARVRLAITGEKQDGSLVDVLVSGQLYLTRDKRRWSIFGYDLQRSVKAS